MITQLEGKPVLKERTLTISMFTEMVNAIKEMRAEMVIGAKNAQYGIEATLPKAAIGVGDPIMQKALDVRKIGNV